MKINIILTLFFISRVAFSQNPIDDLRIFKPVDSIALNAPNNSIIKLFAQYSFPMKKMDSTRSTFLCRDTVFSITDLKAIQALYSFKGKRNVQFFRKNNDEFDLMEIFYDSQTITCYNLKTGQIEIEIANPYKNTGYNIKYIDDEAIFFFVYHNGPPIAGQTTHEMWFTLEKYSISNKTFSNYWESMHFTSYGGLGHNVRCEIHSFSSEEYLIALSYPNSLENQLVSINTIMSLYKKTNNKYSDGEHKVLFSASNTHFGGSEYSYNLDQIIYMTYNIDPLLKDKTRSKTDNERNLVTISTKNAWFSLKPLPSEFFHGSTIFGIGNYFIYHVPGSYLFSKNLTDFFPLPAGDFTEQKIETGKAQYIPHENKYYYYVLENNKIFIYQILTQNL